MKKQIITREGKLEGDVVTIMVENTNDGSDVLVNDANLLLTRMWNN